jgi:hypothetical protein
VTADATARAAVGAAAELADRHRLAAAVVAAQLVAVAGRVLRVAVGVNGDDVEQVPSDVPHSLAA